MRRMKKISFLVLCLMLLFSPIHINGSIIATDDTDDVTHVTWDTPGGTWSATESVSKPEIDITDIQYGSTVDGNRTFSVSVAGTPVINANNLYTINVFDTDPSITQNMFQINLWAGGFIGYSEELPGYMSYESEDSEILLSYNYQAEIFGRSVTFIFPKTVKVFNSSTTSYDDTNLPFPEIPKSTWVWQVWSWSGINYEEHSGDWYIDYYPNGDNPYVTHEEDVDITETSGFDGLIIISGIFAFSVIISRKRLQK
ncbi:MAG: hypothetical protein ACXACX_04450 [Candidatus Hodarchaeales archaeon]